MSKFNVACVDQEKTESALNILEDKFGYEYALAVKEVLEEIILSEEKGTTSSFASNVIWDLLFLSIGLNKEIGTGME